MTTNKLCPSSPMEKGALLMGLVDAQGQIEYLGNPIPINKKFIKIANKGRSPGKDFDLQINAMKAAVQDGKKVVAP